MSYNKEVRIYVKRSERHSEAKVRVRIIPGDNVSIDVSLAIGKNSPSTFSRKGTNGGHHLLR